MKTKGQATIKILSPQDIEKLDFPKEVSTRKESYQLSRTPNFSIFYLKTSGPSMLATSGNIWPGEHMCMRHQSGYIFRSKFCIICNLCQLSLLSLGATLFSHNACGAPVGRPMIFEIDLMKNNAQVNTTWVLKNNRQIELEPRF